jgi:hypothetical protein
MSRDSPHSFLFLKFPGHQLPTASSAPLPKVSLRQLSCTPMAAKCQSPGSAVLSPLKVGVIFLQDHKWRRESNVSSWKLLARILLKKAGVETNTPRYGSEPYDVCTGCGRSVPEREIKQGKCALCRFAEQNENSRSNERKNASSDSEPLTLEKAYDILDCTKLDTDAHIKKRYRELVKECHIDSLPKGLPDYLVQAANRRFHQVQDAYDKIMQARKDGGRA